MYAPRVVATCCYTWLLVLLYSGFRMSEQAAHAAGPPGSAALPQSLRSSSLGQSPQPKPRTASFSDDGCVSPNSISNSVAASMSETSHAGRHPISDGGALYQQLPERPQPIGHFSSSHPLWCDATVMLLPAIPPVVRCLGLVRGRIPTPDFCR